MPTQHSMLRYRMNFPFETIKSQWKFKQNGHDNRNKRQKAI